MYVESFIFGNVVFLCLYVQNVVFFEVLHGLGIDDFKVFVHNEVITFLGIIMLRSSRAKKRLISKSPNLFSTHDQE